MLSDSVIVAMVGSGLTALSTSFVAYVAFMTKRMDRRADLEAMERRANYEVDSIERKVAAIAVQEVKTKLAQATTQAAMASEAVKGVLDENREKLEKIVVIGKSTHKLVNNNMRVQLSLNATLSRRLADITKDPEDVRAADYAAELLADHDRRQALADEANGFPSEPERPG